MSKPGQYLIVKKHKNRQESERDYDVIQKSGRIHWTKSEAMAEIADLITGGFSASDIKVYREVKTEIITTMQIND